MSPRTTIVVPCYNEAARLDDSAFLTLTDSCQRAPELLFVDDGSADKTRERLAGLCARRPGRISMLALEANGGKAEAVRAGLRQAMAGGAAAVGYLDADLSTSCAEMQRLIDLFLAHRVDVLMGARVSLLGRNIQRSRFRHYLGRIFASAASWALMLPVYDTQCGAKLFRCTPTLERALERPFASKWAFDVELLGRLMAGSGSGSKLSPVQIMEEPLHAWMDKPGSKLRSWHMAQAALDMLRIAREIRRAS